MQKAFIFDMDGVLVDGEALWEAGKPKVYLNYFGPEIAAQIGPTTGLSRDVIMQKAEALGAKFPHEDFLRDFHAVGDNVYSNAPLTAGIEKLGPVLKELGYRLGIVSSSPIKWMAEVIGRLPFADDLEVIISLHERDDLPHKPEPDGYIEAMRVLGARPVSTIILEDSNTGIAAARASNAFTIGFRQNLLPGYKQEGADVYAETIDDVISFVRQHAAHQ
jgi:HAD superfamily hydrolase (TIGR01509 family)